MHGREEVIPAETPWGDVTAARCLWPSRKTALTMNPCGVMYSLRAIPMRLWNDIPACAKGSRGLFYGHIGLFCQCNRFLLRSYRSLFLYEQVSFFYSMPVE